MFNTICEKVRCVKRCDIHLNFSTRKEIYTEILVLNLEKRGRAGRKILVLNLEKAYPTFIVDIRPPSSKFHSLMLLSSEQEATTLSLGWNATPVTVLQDSDCQQPSSTHWRTVEKERWMCFRT